jgi:hypothetical protein
MNHIEYPDYQRMRQITNQVEQGAVQLSSLDGSNIIINQSLSGGGTKRMFDVRIHEAPYALGIPCKPCQIETWLNHIKTEQTMTQTIRQLHIPTNPLYEIIPVLLNGYPIPAVLMKRYQDMPYDIRDAKNTDSSIVRYPILKTKALTDTETIRHLLPLLEDVVTLLDAQIQPISSFTWMQDIFNICVFPDGSCRLYLNDLGETKQQPISPIMIDTTIELYVRFAIYALRWGFSLDEYATNMKYFDQLMQNIFSKDPNHPVFTEGIKIVRNALQL